MKQIKELFSTNTNNVFEYTWGDSDGASFSSSDTKYLVTFEIRTVFGIEVLEIAYGYIFDSEVEYTPKNGGFDTDKVKVINTVVKIIKEKLTNDSNYEGLYFSGNVGNGLAGFYNLLIKSLKLKNDYYCFQEKEGDSVSFFLLPKSFKYANDEYNEITIYDNDRLISFGYNRLDIYIEIKLSNLKTIEPIADANFQYLNMLIEEYSIFYDLEEGDTVNLNWNGIEMNSKSREIIKNIMEKYGLVFENNYKTSMEFAYPSSE